MKITMKSALSADISIHDSELLVANLDLMSAFYNSGVGLQIIEKTEDSVLLGYNSFGIIRLISRPLLPFAAPSEAGLFHNAILFDSRAELVSTLYRMIERTPELYTGSGNHLVSEAFYFTDPEGNGVEIYFDLPRKTWQWENGMVKMDTLYIDAGEYIHKYQAETTETNKQIGHIHLKVGDIAIARPFYVDILGFTVTASFPGALFVALGGYHHRIGMNTWLSSGAGSRTKSLGYSNAIFTLENQKDLDKLVYRLEKGKLDFMYNGSILKVSDPWGNDFTFTSK